MKRYLFILRKPAHSGAYLQEMLDIILTTAVFDQQVSLLLLDEGVFHIKKGQQVDDPGIKDTSAIYQALEIYDVNTIYVERESMEEHGLSLDTLNLPVQTCNRKDIAALMQQFDVLLAG